MSRHTQKGGEVLYCPHCKEDQEGVVEDFVVTRTPHVPQEEQCHACDEYFTVAKVRGTDDEYEVQS